MKKSIPLLLIIVIQHVTLLYAQPYNANLKKNEKLKAVKKIAETTVGCFMEDFCDYDLRSRIFADGDIHVPDGTDDIIYGKSGTAYKDVSYPEIDQPSTLGCYSASNDCDPDNYSDVLRYNVYYPKESAYSYDECGPLPCIIFVHGGGNSDCSNFDLSGDKIETLLIELAMRGFIIMNVEYRRGRILDPTPNLYNSVQQGLASYRASQDVRGAIRSIIQRQLDEGTGDPVIDDEYRIDTSKLFLAGNSAGSVAVLRAALYPTQSMINDIFPHEQSSSVTIQNTLGAMNVNLYYGGNTLDYISHIKGILNMWGAIILPGDVADIDDAIAFFADLEDGNKPAIISFCGHFDPVAPPLISEVNFSPDDMSVSHPGYNLANTSTDCTLANFQVDKNSTTNDLKVYGSEKIFELLQNAHILSELYVDCQAGHGLDCDPDADPVDDCTAAFKSDFGTGLTNQANVYTYIAQRAASFFQLVLNNTAFSALGKDLFIECENKRNTCSTTNYYTNNCCATCTNINGHTDKCDKKHQ